MLRFINRLSSYNFCKVLKELHATESILSTIYHHEREPTISVDNKNKQDRIKQAIREDNGYTRTLLSDQIKLGLQTIKDLIDDETKAKFNSMFDPRQGIKIDQSLISDQLPRYRNGLNNQGLFPLIPNSSITRFIMRNVLYQKQIVSKSNNLYSNLNGGNVHHIVGTPGLGKSWSFITLKLLHDKRIPSLIKNGRFKDSIFKVNYKLFYIYAMKERSLIVKHLLDEVKTDFGKIPQRLSKYQNDQLDWTTIESNKKFKQFIWQLRSVYSEKDIVVRFIVDQVNALYNQKQQQRDIYLYNFKSFCQMAKPVVMVSSRNNKYQSIRYDPILNCADSTDQRFIKTVLDNQIGPHQRLVYSMECFLFELQKNGKSRDESIKLIKQIKNEQMYFGTHKSIVQNVRNSIVVNRQQPRQNNKQQQINSNQKQMSENTEIQENFSLTLQNSDLSTMITKFTEYKTKLTNGINMSIVDAKNMKLYIGVLANVLIFSNNLTKEVDIWCSLKVRNQLNQCVQLIKNVRTLYKEVKQTQQQKKVRTLNKEVKQTQQQKNVTTSLAEVNFFYVAEFLNTKLIFFSQTKKILSMLKQLCTEFYDVAFMRVLRQKQTDLFIMLINCRGSIFENSLCHQIINLRKNLEQSASVYITLGLKKSTIIFNMKNFYRTELPSISDPQAIKKELPKILTENWNDHKNGSYIKAGPANPFFDFVLWQAINKKFEIAFVDITVREGSKSITQKQNRFADGITGKNQNKFTQGLKHIIDILSIDSNEVEVTYYVLTNSNLQGAEKQFSSEELAQVNELVSQKIKKVNLSYGCIQESLQKFLNSFRINVNDRPLNLYKKLQHTFNFKQTRMRRMSKKNKFM